MSKFFRAVLFVCVAITIAMAQDPTKVEPNHYKLDFENEHVQVVFVHYGPHEKSHMHAHPQGVVVNLTDGHLRFTDHTGKVQEVFAKRGEARWFPPFQHTVENLTGESYSAVYVGVKSKTASAVSMAPGALLDDDQKARILAGIAR